MDDVNRSICEFEKSGKYYKDARAWYLNTFITPISQRSYLFVLVAFYVVVVCIAAFYYENTNPADPTVNYLLYSDDIAKTYSVIKEPDEDESTKPQIRLTKYILQRYVENREAYDIKKIKDQLEFVRNTTVAGNYLNFENSISINNPSSPMMIYQDQFDKTIIVKKVEVLSPKNKDNSQQAIVYFQSVLRNLSTNLETNEDFVATIDFTVDNIQKLMDDNAQKMQFLVIGYNVMKLNSK